MATKQGDTNAVTELSGADLEAYFTDVKTPEIQDSAAVEEAILLNILRARTPDEALKGGTLTKASDVLGVPLSIRDVHFNRSTFDSREGAYAVIDAVRRDTGEVLTIGCGARKVMIQVYKFKREEWLPAELVFTENTTANGFGVLSLAPVSK
jgi:hypothetical protein